MGVLVTLLLVLRELNRPELADIRRQDDVLTARIARGLYTANVLAYQRAVISLVRRSRPPARVVVLDVERLEIMTITVLDALGDLDRELAQRGVVLHLAALPASAVAVAQNTEWFQALHRDGRVHPSVDAALSSL
jgi:SulP family sulfate permease